MVGTLSEAVEVTSAAPLVELASSTISGNVNATTLRELPLNGRDWASLATLQPGVAVVRTHPLGTQAFSSAQCRAWQPCSPSKPRYGSGFARSFLRAYCSSPVPGAYVSRRLSTPCHRSAAIDHCRSRYLSASLSDPYVSIRG